MQTLLLIICLLLITAIIAVFVLAYRTDKRLRDYDDLVYKPEYEDFSWKSIERSQERRANHWILHNMTDRQLKDMDIICGDLYRKLYK